MVKHKYGKELKSDALPLYSTSSTDIQMVAQVLQTGEMFHFLLIPFIALLLHRPLPSQHTNVFY